jgi:hypothetical protein
MVYRVIPAIATTVHPNTIRVYEAERDTLESGCQISRTGAWVDC